MKNKKKDIVIIAVIIGVFFAGFVIQNLLQQNYENYIKNDYGVVSGLFYSYNEVGAEKNPYLKYKYIVGGVTYSRTIRPKDNPYQCKDNKCIGKKWLVIYSNTQPSKSLINLSHKMTSLDDIRVFNNLDDFE
jgi:hypothetical protein